MTLPSVDRLDQVSEEVLAGFREALGDARFSNALEEEIDKLAAGAPGSVRIPIVRAHLRQRAEPHFQRLLLLAYGGALAPPEVERLFGPDVCSGLRDAGIFQLTGGKVRTPFQIVPLEDCWVLADEMLDMPDSVMPPGPTTAMLARLCPDRLTGSVLDMGCGPGSLALVAAARGAPRVLGCDINPRAIDMAKFNARLNRSVAEFRAGDLFEPARDERFELIVAQPPFIVRPPAAPEIRFLHGGSRGDEIFRRVMRTAHGSLAPRGEVIALCDVALRENQDMDGYLREDLGPCELDLMVLHLAGPSLDTHALLYANHGSLSLGPEYALAIQQYRAHLDAIGVTSFRHSLFVARSPRGGEAATVSVPVRDLPPAKEAVRSRLWAAIDGVAGSDTALLARRVRVAPGAEWISLRDAPEGEQKEHRVRFGPGWPALEQIVSDEGLMLASLLERSQNVEAAIAGYAEMCDASPDEVRSPLLDYIRRSLLGGMLVFEDGGDAS